MAFGLTGSLAVCFSHVRCFHMLLPLEIMPLSVSLVLARILLFSRNATSLNAYATFLNAYSHTLAPTLTPSRLSVQSRAKGKATISRGVEPADHKVSRRRVADCTGAREYLVEGTVVRVLPRRTQITHISQ